MLLRQWKVLLLVFLVVESTHGKGKVLTSTARIQPLKRQSSVPPRECSSLNGNYSDQNNNCSVSADCPTWFVCDDTQSGKCQCGPSYHGAIKCDEIRMISGVLNCYCVTETNGETYIGLCFYNCEPPIHNAVYQTISSRTDLNDFMCGRFNRTGILCGECQKGLSPFVLSYNLSCVECPDGHKNWWKFFLVGFGPLTFLYFFIVFFNINVTSSRLHGYIMYSQALSTPACVRIMLIAVEDQPHIAKAVTSIELFYGLWNLDPFRSILPHVCLNVDPLQAFALDACIAVYPLVLILLSYILIELYDRNVWCIVFIWKPFRSIFKLFRENWDTRTSVIDSFATFFLLSYVKLLSVSADLMMFTSVHELNSKQDHYRIYYAASVEFLEGYHIPYALLSMTLLIFLVALPTLFLILYPFKFFQKCMNHHRNQWHMLFLHAFVDSFQGCYKDGTEPDTYDMRWFSSYGLVLRFGMCIIYTMTLTSMYFPYVLVLILVIVILLINFQPYKTSVSHYTIIDVSFLILLSLFLVSLLGNNITASNRQKYLYFFNALATLSCVIPIIYITSIVLHWTFSRGKWGRMKLKVLLNDNNHYHSLLGDSRSL